MKELPILFNTSMVQSIRSDIKTQTRRTIKGEPLMFLEDGFTPNYVALEENGFCPYGNPGDKLWVRETFCEPTLLNGHEENYYYRADDIKSSDFNSIYIQHAKWHPSIFMTREACRELLQVESLSIERINQIDEPDAIAEGVFFDEGSGYWFVKNSDIMAQDPIDAYCKLWQSINGRPKPVYTKKVITSYVCSPWSDEYAYNVDTWRGKPLIQHVNPWVWVITFKRLNK